MNSNNAGAAALLSLVFLASSGLAQAVTRIEMPATTGVANYDLDGFISISGEARNTSSGWLCSPRVDVELLDAAGKSLSVQSIFTAAKKDAGLDEGDGTYAERIFVPPGEVAVFTYWRDRAKLKGAKPASHRVKVTAGECPAARTSMQVSDIKASHDSEGFYRVRGVIKNVGAGGCRSPRAVLGVYRADGKILKSHEETPDAMFQKILKPGQTVPFEYRTLDETKAIAKSQVWGDCNFPD